IIAVHVTDDVAAGERLKARWDQAGLGVDLVILESPYRTLTGPLLAYIDALESQQAPGTSVVTVLLPEYLPAHWWEHVLHTRAAPPAAAAPQGAPPLPAPHGRAQRALPPGGLTRGPGPRAPGPGTPPRPAPRSAAVRAPEGRDHRPRPPSGPGPGAGRSGWQV